jgi:integrase
LTAIEVSALDVCHVSLDGDEAYAIIVVPNRDARRTDLGPSRRQPITERARFLLGRHLRERKDRCPHHRMLMRTVTDSEGIVRCESCKERHDFMRVPLFDSRESERMSVSRIREDFRRVRDMLGLDRGLTFDSLRETHLATLLDGGGPGKRAA